MLRLDRNISLCCDYMLRLHVVITCCDLMLQSDAHFSVGFPVFAVKYFSKLDLLQLTVTTAQIVQRPAPFLTRHSASQLGGVTPMNNFPHRTSLEILSLLPPPSSLSFMSSFNHRQEILYTSALYSLAK